MNQILGRDTIHPTQTPKEIDNSDLYEYIGDLVIERADAGDKYCEEIFSRAYKKTTTNLNENKAGRGWQSHRPADTPEDPRSRV